MGSQTINEGSLVGAPSTSSAEAAPWMTFSDLYEHLFNFAQGVGVGVPPSAHRAAIVSAYEEVIAAHEWSFLRGMLRVQGYANQTTGTLAYTHSTRIATLSDATFPSWADGQGGAIYVDDVLCEIEAQLSSTTVRFKTGRNPGEDLSAETYSLFKLWYALPQDFLALEDPIAENTGGLGRHVSFSSMVYEHRADQTSGEFGAWSIGPNPTGGHALYVYPALSAATRIDAPYIKRPRDVSITGLAPAHKAGTISVSGTTVTGDSTSFASGMAGSVLRVSSTSTAPDGVAGPTDNLFAEERLIESVTDTTTLTLALAGTTASAVGYRVSDPLSVGRVAWNALRRCAEMHLARTRNFKNYRDVASAYYAALGKAKGDDAVEQPRRVMGRSAGGRRRLSDMYVLE